MKKTERSLYKDMKQTIRTYSDDTSLVTIRRKQIAECAAELFSRQGYHPTTVRQVAKACGMSMGAFYHYIGSKEDLLSLLTDRDVSQFEDFCEQISGLTLRDPIPVLRQAIEKYYRLIDANQDRILLLHQEARNLHKKVWQSIVDLELRVFAVFEKILAAGCKNGDFDVFNIGLTVHTIVITAQAWAVRRWYLRKHCTIEEYIAAQTDLFLKSIAVNPGKKNKGKMGGDSPALAKPTPKRLGKTNKSILANRFRRKQTNRLLKKSFSVQ